MMFKVSFTELKVGTVRGSSWVQCRQNRECGTDNAHCCGWTIKRAEEPDSLEQIGLVS